MAITTPPTPEEPKEPGEFAKPVSYKGYAPGTFSISYERKEDRPVVKAAPKIERRPVGGEVRSPETEELIRLGKLAKAEGFTFQTDEFGNVSSVDIPKEWAGDEEALRIELMEKKAEADILKELLPLSLLYTENNKEADFLKPKIQNPATLALIEHLSEELKKLVEEVYTKPEGTKLDEIRQKLPDFERAVKRARTEVSKIPVPPAPIATPAPTAAPAMPALPLYGGWPTFNVFYRKQTKTTPGGWFSRNQSDPLPEQDQWENEYKAFEVAYRKYLDFVKNMKLSERQLIRPLIEARIRVIDAIKDTDIARITSEREAFESALEDWQKRWEKLGKVREGEKKLGELKKVEELVLANIESATELENLRARKGAVVNEIQKAKDAALAGNSYDLEVLSSILDSYKKTIERYKATHDSLSIQSKDREGNKKVIGVLRPIRATDKNREQKIKLIDGRGKTVGEYEKELNAQQEEEDKITLTERDIAEWPELARAGHAAGSKIEEERFDKFQTGVKYMRMLERDENAFLSLYVTPSEDPDTHEIVYTATENLRKHPHQEIIRDVLREVKGIAVVDLTRKELKTEEAKKKEEEYVDRTRYSMTYNPRKDIGTGAFGQRKKETKISNTGGMEADKGTKNILKRKPATMATGLDNELEPVMPAPRPLTPEEETKKRETLRKVEDILRARNELLAKKKTGWGGGRLPWYWGAVAAFVGAAMLQGDRFHEKRVNVLLNDAISAAYPDEISRRESKAAETGGEATEAMEWQEYFNDKAFLKDFTSLSKEQLVMKYAPQSADPNKLAAVSNVLDMEGYRVLKEPNECYGLGDDARSELCRFIRKLEQVSQAIDAPERSSATLSGTPYTNPNDMYITPKVKIGSYIETIKEKIKEANRRFNA